MCVGLCVVYAFCIAHTYVHVREYICACGRTIGPIFARAMYVPACVVRKCVHKRVPIRAYAEMCVHVVVVIACLLVWISVCMCVCGICVG